MTDYPTLIEKLERSHGGVPCVATAEIRRLIADNEALRKANLDCVDHYNDCRAEAEELRTQVDALSKDAERYQILRNPDYQQHEDDISVSDSSFNVYFGDDLDREVDGLKDRHDAIMNAGDKPPQVGID